MSDTKHGWVTPRADGARARCGGPGLCPTCSTEAMHEKMLSGLFGAPADVGAASAQDDTPKNSFGSVSFTLTDGSAVACEWSPSEWSVSFPANRQDRDVAFKELLQEIGRLRAAAAAPAAGDARAALAKVESLQRYGFGYADDGNGGRYLSSLKRDDGAFLRRDEVLVAIAAQQGKGDK